MIEVQYHNGLYLPELDLWLDPHDQKSDAFVSHAHADHVAQHPHTICSAQTAKLIAQRFGADLASLEPLEMGNSLERGNFQLRLLPAGHIFGSAMLHVTRKTDSATLLYTGDFKTRPSRTCETARFLQADTLIMETTFGQPQWVFPSRLETDAALLRFVTDAWTDSETPVIFGYSLGKAQEALALLAENKIRVLSHPTVAAMTEVCRSLGLDLPEPETFTGKLIPETVILAPPNAVKSKALRNLKNTRTAMLSGWGLQPSAIYRYRVDQMIPMSDHADHPGLHEAIARVRPKRVLTVHGYTKQFAAELRAKGLEAWCAAGGDQMELTLDKNLNHSAASQASRLSTSKRPSCQLADFSDVCALVASTNSRLEKTAHLTKYFLNLSAPKDLASAARWLSGEILPRYLGKRALHIGSATIKRALLSLPGANPQRYREISAIQNDTARTARLFLETLPLSPQPADIADLNEFFDGLQSISSSLAKAEAIQGKLLNLHPAEGESFIKILGGDLRIGLKAGLVEDAIAQAFSSDITTVKKANMLLGDIGETIQLAQEEKLDTAQLTPFVPIRAMLASPLERDDKDDSLIFEKIPFSSPYWLEPKFDGIRAQLHKIGPDLALFSRDLRPLDGEFPDLLESAKDIPGDFILDGELIAHAEGRRLTFADLQKRLGRKKAIDTDLFAHAQGAPEAIPLKYIPFDILYHSGQSLLDQSLAERRQILDTLPLSGMFATIDLIHATNPEELENAFKKSIKDHYEGLIAKDPASHYTPGRRGKAWIKLKGVMPTLDCVVVAAEQGHGRRNNVLSDYTYAVRDEQSGELRILGKAYSGLTDLEIEELTEHFKLKTLRKEKRKHHLDPDIVLEIAFDSIQASKRHDSGLALRFPRIKGIRRDKTIADIDTLRTAKSLLQK